MKKKVKFVDYYKYVFYFKDDDGNEYATDGDIRDMYRFSVSPENELEKKVEKYYIDGLECKKL